MESEMAQVREAARSMDSAQKALYFEKKQKNPGLAAVASFLIPGLGQIWLGKLAAGILIFLLCWLVLPWLYGIYDAYRTAKKYNADLYESIYRY